MFNAKRKVLKIAQAVVVFLVAILMQPLANAENNILIQEATETETLKLVVGKSVVLKSLRPVNRVSIADQAVADFLLSSANEIYINPKKPGTTNITFWQDNKIAGIYDLSVVHDVSALKQQLHQILPEEKNIMVVSSNDTITLTGKVSNNASLYQAMAIARSFAAEDKINNLLEVGGIHQVMLEVRVAEISKDTTKRLGINLIYRDGEKFGIGLLGSLAEFSEFPFSFDVSPKANALFRIVDGEATWTGLIDALKEDGLAKVLAEPTLIALSGQNASFLAGGEFPIPVPQGDGDITIEYREFGVSLNFTPTVLNDKKIAISVAPEVSELDFSTAVRFSGFVAPGITTRRAATTIELGDGQSFAIAGLLQENISDNISRYPILGDIPVLGALFRSRSFQKRETELVIVVTPRLVKPVSAPDQLVLPTDYYYEPNDFEIYLGGALEQKNPMQESMRHLEGEFGHVLPELN